MSKILLIIFGIFTLVNITSETKQRTFLHDNSTNTLFDDYYEHYDYDLSDAAYRHEIKLNIMFFSVFIYSF